MFCNNYKLGTGSWYLHTFFLRFAKEQPSYYPPKDVEEQLQNIGKKVFGSEMNASWEDQSLNDPLLKFKVWHISVG